jgi:hypothetical protein
MQMTRVAEILGFDRKKLWWYRDIALATVAIVGSLWGVVALFSEKSDFQIRFGTACVVIAAVCCGISPNRLMLLGSVSIVVAVQGWFAVLLSHNQLGWWVAIPAMTIATIFFLMFGKRPIRKSSSE